MQYCLPGLGYKCPLLQFNEEWLVNAVSPTCHMSLQTLVQTLGVHCNTLCHHFQINGLIKQFSDIPEVELDVLILYATTSLGIQMWVCDLYLHH